MKTCTLLALLATAVVQCARAEAQQQTEGIGIFRFLDGLRPGDAQHIR